MIVTAEGERVERRYIHHLYSMKEWAEMLREAGFDDVQTFGRWDSERPATPEDWRLIICAR